MEVAGLRKTYGAHEAVRGIDLSVARGEVFGFLGTNGAGKTTTIEILEGYRGPHGRRGRRCSASTRPSPPAPGATASAWCCRSARWSRSTRSARPSGSTRASTRSPAGWTRRSRLVGLADKADARLGTLSGGQKRRVDVAIALIGDPDLVFLDEPTTGFDPAARREFWNVIEGLAGLGVTIFLTTHYMDEAQHLAARVAILRDGRIVAQGRPEELGSGETVVRFRAPAGVAPDAIAAAAEAQVSSSGNEVSFTSPDPQRALARLLAWAEREGVALDGLDVHRPSLEDVFLELTRDQDGDV